MTARPTRAFRVDGASLQLEAWPGTANVVGDLAGAGVVGDQVAVDGGDPARR